MRFASLPGWLSAREYDGVLATVNRTYSMISAIGSYIGVDLSLTFDARVDIERLRKDIGISVVVNSGQSVAFELEPDLQNS
jgi:hypothetical protein